MSLDATVFVELNTFTLDLKLNIDPGNTTAIIGANGAGKTTLLRTLAGLRALSAGKIVLNDTVLDEPATNTFVPPEQRGIGVVFHDSLLFPHLTAIDNVAFGLRSAGTSRRDARDLAGEWLTRVGLSDKATAKPSNLSTGQSQRVALARALATSPALLLLDEPLAALDMQAREEMRHELQSHLATFSGVRLLITHDLTDAQLLAHNIVQLENGRVVTD